MTKLATVTLSLLLSTMSACTETSTDPGQLGGALQKVTPVANPKVPAAQPLPVRPPAITPTPVIPKDLDRAFDVEENTPVDGVERADAGQEEDEEVPGKTKLEHEAGRGSLPGATPGARPVNPTVKPLSPPPAGL